MIEKNKNIHKDSSIKRIVEVDPESKQINILDQRYYKRNGLYYPSVTSVLNYFPKNKFFEEWLKDVGHSADIIARKAAEEGTLVHESIEKYLKGEELIWIEENGIVNYPLEVWRMILKFTDFWTTYKPKLIASEHHIFSDEHQYAGTIDLVVELGEKRWLLDIKTSNSLHTSYELQLAAYANAWNESFEEKIDNVGIIWLKSSKRGADKKGKSLQGNGWELKSFERSYQDSFILFKNIYDLYKLEHPEHKPYSEVLPVSVKL